MSRLTSVALLGAAVATVVGFWWIFGPEAPRPSRPSRPPPHDDLDLIVALLDGGAREVPRDQLVAVPDGIALARASDHTITVTSTDGHSTRTIAHLDSPARALGYAAGQIWIATEHTLQAVPLAGGEPRPVGELTRARGLASDGQWVFVVDVDAAPRTLTPANVVIRLSPDGADRRVLGRSDGEISGIAVEDGRVYWADRLEGSIVVVDENGGSPQVLAADRGLPGSLVVARGDAYWVEKRSESIWRMSTRGGAPERVAQDFAGFANLLVDARGVFWTNEAAVDGEFRVLTVGPDGEVSAASGEVAEVDALASDGAHLYWARNGAVSLVSTP